jgi:AbrB family looped-hinge helix DNA binding protein
MPVATLTSKGQVTIPKRVREQLQLQSGDRVDFRIDEDGTVRLYPVARRVPEVFGAFAGKAVKAHSPREMKERVRRAFGKGTL